MTDTATLAPVTLTLELACSAEHAFKVYTDDIASWWPLDTHSVDHEKAEGVVFEAKPEGRIYEIGEGGKEHLWGIVETCEAPTYLKYSWFPGREPKDVFTEVEIRFIANGDSCRVELTHTGFERYGESAGSIRDNYVTGWAFVAGERFKTAAEA